jgi:hypothetical protein
MHLAVRFVHFFVAMRSKRPILPRQMDGVWVFFWNNLARAIGYMPSQTFW